MEWLEKTREKKKNAEFLYHEEIRTVNREKTKINDRLVKFRKSNFILFYIYVLIIELIFLS